MNSIYSFFVVPIKTMFLRSSYYYIIMKNTPLNDPRFEGNDKPIAAVAKHTSTLPEIPTEVYIFSEIS